MRKRIVRSSLAVLAVAAVTAGGSAARAQTVLFADEPTAFEGQGCGGQGCWTNHMRLTDLDGDGDLDAIFANLDGFFVDPEAQPLEIWRNGGAGDFTLATEELLGGPVLDPIRVVAVGDVDGDGDRDLVGPSAAGTPDRLWIQGDDGTFTEEGGRRLGTSSRSAAVRLGDVDGDGDLDLLVGQGYAGSDVPPARLLLNDGAGTFTPGGALPGTAEGTDPDDVDLLDADGDFDLDVLVNFHVGPNALWLNDGAGVFTDASDQLAPPEDDRYHYGPTACDVDGDGDRDILVDNIGPGFTEQVSINDGTGRFSAESGRLGGNDANDDNGVVCLDFDDDGDQDVIVASLQSNGERLFANDGSGTFERVPGAFTALVDPTLWMEVGDVDGDGRLDAVTAQGEGSPESERLYLGTDAVAQDRTPPVIFAWNTTFWPEVRFALRDASSSDEGPRVVNVEAQVPDAEAPFPATPMGGDLFRVVVPEGSTELALCATDPVGNTGCIDVEPGPGQGGAGGEGPGATTGVVTGSGATTGASTGAGGGGGAPDGGEGEGGDDRAIIDRGCGCSVPGAVRTEGEGDGGRGRQAAALAALAVLALARGARRRSTR